MKRRQEIGDHEEQQAADSLRALLRERNVPPVAQPDPAFFSRLIVQTNQQIDGMTSGKAISLSWAARVAIPGVVAIISFFIALYYYTPPQPAGDNSMVPMLGALSTETIDSLLVENSSLTDVSFAVLGVDVFDVSGDEAVEYLIASGNMADVMETMDTQQMDQVLTILGSRPD